MVYRLVMSRSPNCDDRPAGTVIDTLVLHYTGMPTADEAIARLCDPAAEVSAHYVIDRKGCVYALVPEDKRAWHAGVSFWAGKPGVNARSIGIELVNPGHEFGYVPYTDDQLESLIELGGEILRRHPIGPRGVVGHSDVAPARKNDPGELFPWARLAAAGIGLWPADCESLPPLPVEDLARYGYGLPPDCDVPRDAVIRAFQRRFRPSRIDGWWDVECGRRLAGLLRH
ncbi:MAG: N-acetylmuramoyl-L-alanine amidase [Rhizomicrobium sp.]